MSKPKLDAPPLARGWKLVLRDTRQNTVEAIAGALTVPEAARQYLIEQVTALDARVALVKLDAHCSFINGAFHVNISVVPL